MTEAIIMLSMTHKKKYLAAKCPVPVVPTGSQLDTTCGSNTYEIGPLPEMV